MRKNWARIRLRLFAAVTITSAAVISFSSLQHLAEQAGFGTLSWLFPLTLDAVAAFGLEIWIRNQAAWRSGATLALVAITGSLAANVTYHWMVSHTVLAALLGAAPPGMLAALMFVMHRHIAGHRPQPSVPEPQPAPEAAPEQVPSKPTPKIRGVDGPAASTTPVQPEQPYNGNGNGHGSAPVTLAKPTPPTRPSPLGMLDTQANPVSKPKPAAKPQPSTSLSVVELTEKLSERLANGEALTKRSVQDDYTVGSNKAGQALKAARDKRTEEVTVHG